MLCTVHTPRRLCVFLLQQSVVLQRRCVLSASYLIQVHIPPLEISDIISVRCVSNGSFLARKPGALNPIKRNILRWNKHGFLLLGTAFDLRGRAGRGAEPSVLGFVSPGWDHKSGAPSRWLLGYGNAARRVLSPSRQDSGNSGYSGPGKNAAVCCGSHATHCWWPPAFA